MKKRNFLFNISVLILFFISGIVVASITLYYDIQENNSFRYLECNIIKKEDMLCKKTDDTFVWCLLVELRVFDIDYNKMIFGNITMDKPMAYNNTLGCKISYCRIVDEDYYKDSTGSIIIFIGSFIILIFIILLFSCYFRNIKEDG